MVATKEVRSFIDPTSTYAGISIKTPNRNEVQIFHLGSKQVISSFELDSEDKISTVGWTQPTVNEKKSRKRTNAQNGSSSISVYLIVALEQGDILVLSPFQRDIANKISNESKIISITAAGANSFFGLEVDGRIKEFPIVENKLLRTLTFSSDKSLKSIKYAGDDVLYTSSNCLYVVKAEADEDGELELVLRFPVPRGHANAINSIVHSHLNAELVITSKHSDDTIFVYNKKVNTAILKSASNVIDLKAVVANDVEYLVAVLENGDIELFKDFHEKRSKSDELHSFLKLESDAVLDNIFSDGKSLQCLWFDNTRPQLSSVDVSQTSIRIQSLQPSQGSEEQLPDADSEMAEAEETENSDELSDLEDDQFTTVSSDELYKLVVSAIDSNDDDRLVAICNSNKSALSIKQALLKNVTAEQSLVLFKKLSLRVSSQPSDSTTLSLWLKLILLIHGNNIIKSDDNVSVLKLLRSSLLENTKNLSNLVALQGRLQLLKSQLQLRNEMDDLDLEDSDEDDEEDEDALEEQQDEEAALVGDDGEASGNGSYYINGEGDDDAPVSDDGSVEVDDDEEY